jgi:hypothetical protein
MIHLIEKFMLGLLEMGILWLAYVAFIKLIIQRKQNKQ